MTGIITQENTKNPRMKTMKEGNFKKHNFLDYSAGDGDVGTIEYITCNTISEHF